MNVNISTSLNASKAVFKESILMPENSVKVSGIDYSKDNAYNMNAKDLLDSMKNMGFQASSIGHASDIINEMRNWKGIHKNKLIDTNLSGKFHNDGHQRSTIFLGYTSNLISSGLRETIRFLVQHKMVDVIVTTAGGVEEDLIKVLAPTFIGDFSLCGKTLREKGINRIGNLLVPNDNYCKFEDWLNPILNKCLEEQEAKKKQKNISNEECFLSPSQLIKRLGQEINDESSVLYWAYKNDIPIFCPALTDGSIGDMIFFQTYKTRPNGLVLDIVSDIYNLNYISMQSYHASIIILGGGIVKHHICNACLMRNGADLAVFINTGNEYDGSDSGARPDEAISWGKIKSDSKSIKIFADASLAFPIIVAATFAKEKIIQ